MYHYIITARKIIDLLIYSELVQRTSYESRRLKSVLMEKIALFVIPINYSYIIIIGYMFMVYQ